MIGFIGWMLVVFAAAAFGGLASRHARDFYAGLAKPSWAPPGWVFGPVWSVLYVLMGVAAWLVWRRAGWSGASAALSLFLAQLMCNALWSWLFFALRRGALAFVDVVLLLVLIVATLLAFLSIHTVAAILLLPYLAWVTFATALTWAVWRANPDQL